MDFLKIVFKDAPEGSLVRLVTGSFGDANTRYIKSSLLLVTTRGLTESLGTTTNVWFAPAVLQSPGDEKQHVLASHVLWVDVDAAAPPRSAFPPTFVVASGHGYHYYYVLKGWLTDTAKLEALNRLMVDELEGGDVACFNCNRLMRVPDTVNAKEDSKPVPVLLVGATDIEYEVGDFDVLPKLNDKLKRKLATGDSRGFRSQSELDWHIVRGLLLAGASEDLVKRLAFNSPWSKKFIEEGDRYFERTLARAKQRATGSTTATGQLTGVIEEREDGYYITNAAGGARRVTTFRFTPTLLLEHPDCDVLRGEVRAAEVDHVWKDVNFTRRAFNSHAAFVKELPYASWQVLAGDMEVKLLLPHILKQLTDKGLPRVKATSVLGQHGDAFVGTNCVVTKEGARTYDDAPIVYVEPGHERPAFLSHPLLEAQAVDVPRLLTRVLAINVPCVTYPLLGWFTACAYKHVLHGAGVRFPILNVFGTRGSGKTTTIHLLSRMFGNTDPVSYDATTTRFVTLSLMGSINAGPPVSFSEFRSAHGTGILRFILLSYDVGRDARGHADQTTTTYPLLAPIVVDGEDMVADPAAKERIVAVNMHPEDLTDERRSVLLSLSNEEVSSFAIPYLQRVLCTEVPQCLDRARQRVTSAFPERIPDRIRNNLSIVAFGLEVLEVPWERAHLEASLLNIYNARMARTEAMVDEFVTAVVNACEQRKSDFFWHSDTKAGILWFHFTTALMWWFQLARRAGTPMLAREALKVQIQERYDDYMVPSQAVGTKFMFGVNLKKAVALGLDVPSEVTPESQVILEV